MALRSIHDIPDEIKNIIELFYLRGEIVARDEMVKLRATRADLNNLIDEVSQLFPTAPESVFMFYDALIAADGLASNLDSDLAFAVSDLMGDASDAPESDFRFSVSGSSKLIAAEPNRRTRRTEEASDYAPLLFDFPETIDDDESLDAAVATEVPSFREKLNESLQASTQVPSIFADGSDGRKPDGQSYGLRGRELSSNPEKSTEINLDIDIDFDFFASGAEEVIEGGLEVGGADIVGESGEHESVIKLKNSDDLIEKASNEYMTPVPNNMQAAQIDKLQEKSRSVSSSMPSIMRASQKPSPSEEYSQPRRISEFFDSELASDSHIRVGRTSSSSLAAQSRPTLPHTEAVALSSSSLRLGESRTNTLYMGSSSFDLDDPVFGKPTSVALNTISPVERLEQGGRGLAALNKIQPVQRSPRLLCKMSELSQKKGINSKAGFILSMIDGNTTIADILDISAWSESETAILLLELEEMGIVSLG